MTSTATLVFMELFYDALQRPIEKPDDVPVGRRISGYALVIRDAAVLTVVPTWNTLYELPGGGLHEGESLVAGIVRECKEETGHDVAIDDEVPIHSEESNFYLLGEKKFYYSSVRVCNGRLLSTKPDLGVANAHSNEIKWSGFMPITELTKENCHPNFWPVIDQMRNG